MGGVTRVYITAWGRCEEVTRVDMGGVTRVYITAWGRCEEVTRVDMGGVTRGYITTQGRCEEVKVGYGCDRVYCSVYVRRLLGWIWVG